MSGDRVGLDDFNSIPSRGPDAPRARLADFGDAPMDDVEEPFALFLPDFIAAKSESPAALVGDDDEVLLPAAGLLLLVAKGGRGKTTLALEAALAWASGVEWLGFAVSRPLRVLIVENEGARELFRRKLEAKLESWQHEIRGSIAIHTIDWGCLSLANDTQAELLRRFVIEHAIDVIVGDPLDSLGLDGVGSPEDTRNFMALMTRVGLFRDVAFVLLHHPRKEQTTDELDEAAGAWGGRPDTMLKLAKLDGSRARLSFPKIRWSRRGSRPALLLSFDMGTQSYSVIGEETEDERDLLQLIRELLDDDAPRTVKEIAVQAEGGIGAREPTVKALLEANPDAFEPFTGEAARALGRHPSAKVWKVRRPPGAGVSPSPLWEEQATRCDVLPPYRGARSGAASPPTSTSCDAEPGAPVAPSDPDADIQF